MKTPIFLQLDVRAAANFAFISGIAEKWQNHTSDFPSWLIIPCLKKLTPFITIKIGGTFLEDYKPQYQQHKNKYQFTFGTPVTNLERIESKTILSGPSKWQVNITIEKSAYDFPQAFFKNLIQFPCIIFSTSAMVYPRLKSREGIPCKSAMVSRS